MICKEDITFAVLEVFLFTCLQGEEIFCYGWQAKDGVYAWEKIGLNWEVIHQTHEVDCASVEGQASD